jgi:crotonobetainyl-CoA:carnitine CoA-transferase CaiB-like acyl-CoA transferase
MFTQLKVIDISTVLAGPSVGMFFAELGAEVIKIEHPNHPDVTRSWKGSEELGNSTISSYFSSVNYKKKYISLDLNSEYDKISFFELLKNADILISNFKSSDYVKFGLECKVLKSLNPKLIHGRISGFGSNSDRVAYDLILQAESGFMSINGLNETDPIKMPVALIDVLTAHQLKEGLLIALLEREKTNIGRDIHVSLYKTAVCSLVNQASSYLMTNRIPNRIGSLHPSIAPYGEIFKTKEGELITFAIGSNLQFEKLIRKLGLIKLINNPLFLTNQLRVINRSELANLIQQSVELLSVKELLNWSLDNHIPCGHIKNIKEVFQNQSAQDLIRTEVIDGIQTKRVTSISFEIE